MAGSPFLTRKEAAAVCECSENTLRRDQREGRLPQARLGDDGATLYAVSDLVAIERLDPLTAPGAVHEVVGYDRTGSELAVARRELASAQARIADQASWIARIEDEVAFLRSLLAKGRFKVA